MLTLGFGEELENVGFPVALSLMEESACKWEEGLTCLGKDLDKICSPAFLQVHTCPASLWRLLHCWNEDSPVCPSFCAPPRAGLDSGYSNSCIAEIMTVGHFAPVAELSLPWGCYKWSFSRLS